MEGPKSSTNDNSEESAAENRDNFVSQSTLFDKLLNAIAASLNSSDNSSSKTQSQREKELKVDLDEVNTLLKATVFDNENKDSKDKAQLKSGNFILKYIGFVGFIKIIYFVVINLNKIKIVQTSS
jgi:hypothetical protein